MKTGEKITGPMDMRKAWFFNDLKPRVYYANGGDSYFASLYIQDIASLISNILPSTNPVTRFQVERLGPIAQGQILITYDYSSFTSNLSELKYFLYYLGLSFHGVDVDVYDPFVGVKSIDLGSLISDYNEFANHYCLFSVERFDKFIDNPVFRMGQSGALGIKGNIVFSTSLHGLALADITGNWQSDSVVGDDALCYIFTSFLKLFISCVNNLGSINEDKFSSVLNPLDDPLRLSSFKYLKRPLSLYPSGPVLGSLDFFPDLASVFFPDGDGIHTVVEGTSKLDTIVTLCSQICRYSLITSRASADVYSEIFAEEEHLVLLLFRAAYEKLGLPIEGHAPGFCVELTVPGCSKEYATLHSFIPPIDSDVLITSGWISVCYARFGGELFEVPDISANIPPPEDHYQGQVFMATSSKTLTMLVGLGFLTQKIVLRVVHFDIAYANYLEEVTRESYDSGEEMMYTYTVESECPHYYDLVREHLFLPTYDQGIPEA
jgi:hypothetical protein